MAYYKGMEDINAYQQLIVYLAAVALPLYGFWALQKKQVTVRMPGGTRETYDVKKQRRSYYLSLTLLSIGTIAVWALLLGVV